MRYTASIEVEGEPEVVAKLRSLLPEFVNGNGMTAASGTKIIETWMVRETEVLAARPKLDWSPGIADHKANGNRR
jgi:hypothetical protein